jgi:hypothetical protein
MNRQLEDKHRQGANVPQTATEIPKKSTEPRKWCEEESLA